MTRPCAAVIPCLVHDAGEELLIGAEVLLKLQWVQLNVSDWHAAVDDEGIQKVKHTPAEAFPDESDAGDAGDEDQEEIERFLRIVRRQSLAVERDKSGTSAEADESQDSFEPGFEQRDLVYEKLDEHPAARDLALGSTPVVRERGLVREIQDGRGTTRGGRGEIIKGPPWNGGT